MLQTEYATRFAQLDDTSPEEIRSAAKWFEANIRRVRQLVAYLPQALGHTIMVHHLNCCAELEVIGTLRDSVETRYDQPTAAKMQAALDRRAEVAQSRHEAEPDRINALQLDMGLNILERHASIDVTMVQDSIETLMALQVIGTWTAVESVAGDLWEAAVNIHPRSLSLLNGTYNRIRKLSLDFDPPIADEEAIPGRKALKQINLEAIQGAGFDLTRHMGTLHRNSTRCRFDRLDGIRRCYSLAFPDKDSEGIDNALKQVTWDALSVLRNVLVHKAGLADSQYADAAKDLPGLPNVPIGSMVPLDGEMVANLVNGVLDSVRDLVMAVDAWIRHHAIP